MAAAVSTADLVLLGVLLLFALWGAVKGPWRQAASLGLLAAAFPVANRWGVGLETTVRRALPVTDADVPLVAWGVAFFGTLLAGGLLLALLQPLFRGRREAGEPPVGGRGAGALLGLFHGVAFLTVVVYGLLVGFSGSERPSWIRSLEASHGAGLMRHVVGGARRLTPLPPVLDERLTAVDERIGAAAPQQEART